MNADAGSPSPTVGFGSPHLHYRRTDSTNERAKNLAIGGAPAGLVVTADEQTAGRGRRGNEWFAPPGSCLLYSALLHPYSADDMPLLPLALPVAVCEAAESIAPVRCQVKWPNDVWVDERKVSGMLVEARPDDRWAVLGVGLNVAIPQDEFPPELRETAASLLPTEADDGVPPGGAPGVRRALAAVNECLGRWVSASQEEVLGAFRTRDALSGRRISWDGGEGRAEEIDERGHLVVEKPDGERVTLGAGEVHLAVERSE
jgi:BirA family biotin operon repressor/biotin-[acetyl-CoA-carboxylase] ligase